MSFKIRLPIGSLGISQDAIAKDKMGGAFMHYFPEYAKKTFEIGQYNVHALEDIRAQRDVIVVDTNNGVIEHTPTELKYSTRVETWQRVTWENPLPVTMGSKSITHVLPTIIIAAGVGQIVPAPGAGKRLLVHYYSISNRHGAAADIGLTFDSAGAAANIRFRQLLAPTGGNVNINLTDCCFEGGNNQALFGWANAAYAGGVIFCVGITIEDVPT